MSALIRGVFWFLDCCCLVFLLFPWVTFAQNTAAYQPADVLLINCGSSGRSADYEKRGWQGDVGSSKFVVSNPANSFVATASSQSSSSVPSVPFSTARIFTGNVTYSVPVTAMERKFVRLYFYASEYGGRNTTSATFSVQVGDHKLLGDFNPAWDMEAMPTYYIIREYSLNVSQSGFLNLTFTPSDQGHPGSYGFINGIEVISIPDIFSSILPLPVVGLGTTFSLTPTTAMETMYRLNAGGAAINRTADSGLFREWSIDDLYIFGNDFGLIRSIDPNITLRYLPATPKYMAPDAVYSTQRSMTGLEAINRQSNLTWMFTVDPGYHYLVRLHLCDIQSIYNKRNERVFSIYINNMTANDQADVYAWAADLLIESTSAQQGGSASGVPFFKDYIAYNGPGQVDLRLDLHPNDYTKPEYVDAVMNGIEVFKLNNVYKFNDVVDNTLVGSRPPPLPSVTADPSKAFHLKTATHGSRAGGVIGGAFAAGSVVVIFVVALLCLVRKRRRRTMAKEESKRGRPHVKEISSLYNHSPQMGSTLATDVCRRFTFTEIEDATQGFVDSLVIGVGGFGKVYKGVIHPDRSMVTVETGVKVAIKRAHPTSQQGIREFLNEVEMLSKLRHRHLVSLFGFCDERGEMILVYEYLGNGTLRDHLYNTSGKPTLNWRQRLEICIDAARGLHYLHTGVRHTIIHRDVKSTNILLDDTWVAKVADFGLCKVGPEMDRHDIAISTAVKGSFGYLDPDYFRRQKLTDKSDVYSFGVVLFEVLCSRPAVDVNLPHEQVCLAEWARYCFENGLLETMVNQNLKKQIAPECFYKFSHIATKCVADTGINRPSMGDVLWSLESAKQLQDDFEKELNSSSTICRNHIVQSSIDSDGLFSADAIFSEIANPRGR